MFRVLMFAALAGSWQFATEQDPMGVPVYVASIAPDEARPEVALRFSCGGVVGVVLQFNLGDIKYEWQQFSTDEPPEEDVRFSFVEGRYDSAAKRAPIADGLGTYEIKGSEAAFLVGLIKDSEVGPVEGSWGVEVSRGEAAFMFPLAGARGAIDQALEACPYKYPDV
jgi:hypothetical protein